ncbi:hypothetical protein ACIBO5_45285 [Nonomuraea angiospora]|uniref:hypothetical protein n=1 Tax=Nonomuraea angiospora TaxID=46172 RepID=UPI00378CADE8
MVMVAAVAVALVGEVLLRRYTRWFTANLSRRSQGTVQARGCLAYLVSVTVGVALAPAVAQPPEQTILLLITAGGAVAWAIWSWSGWTSAAVLPCVLTWAQ